MLMPHRNLSMRHTAYRRTQVQATENHGRAARNKAGFTTHRVLSSLCWVPLTCHLNLKIQMTCSPDAKSWLIGKDPDAGQDERREEKGTAEDEMVGRHHQLNGQEFLSKLWETVKDREAWHAAIRGVTKTHTWLSDSTKTTTTYRSFPSTYSPKPSLFDLIPLNAIAQWFLSIFLCCSGVKLYLKLFFNW